MAKKIRSKYLNRQFGNWTCIYVGIATVQGKKAKWSGHRSYYYIFQRRTSDDKADKMIKLNSIEASQVYHGKILVEQILDKRETRVEKRFSRKVSYHFN